MTFHSHLIAKNAVEEIPIQLFRDIEGNQPLDTIEVSDTVEFWLFDNPTKTVLTEKLQVDLSHEDSDLSNGIIVPVLQPAHTANIRTGHCILVVSVDGRPYPLFDVELYDLGM